MGVGSTEDGIGRRGGNDEVPLDQATKDGDGSDGIK